MLRLSVRPSALQLVTRTAVLRRFASTESSTVNLTWDNDPKAPGVAIITLNRPNSLNALTAPMGDKLVEIVKSLQEEPKLNAVVLTGAGTAFSAGGDLAFLDDRTKDVPIRNVEEMKRFYMRFLSVRSLPVPVIAAMNGHAVGAGCCLAVACDIRIAQEGAKMGMNFVRLGLHPGMGATHYLATVVNAQQTARLLLTGDLIPAKEAAAIGLVASVVPNALEAALTMARRIASASPIATRTLIRSLRMKQDVGVEQALWREADAQAHCYASADMVEGLKAIKAKRDPVFSPSFGGKQQK